MNLYSIFYLLSWTNLPARENALENDPMFDLSYEIPRTRVL